MTHRLCRHCATALDHVFADLGVSPLSNAFLGAEALGRAESFYPLRAYVCHACFLVQLEEYESRDRIFNDKYAYFSSFSDSWLRHARDYVDTVTRRFALDERSFVVEIASNDGYLLQYFAARSVPILGIEPAANCADAARTRGVDSLVRFFGRETASEVARSRRKADLLIGNNVLAHVPDLDDFVSGMRILLADTGVITMEFPHLLSLMRENQFDTIYHEHFSYLSMLTVTSIFRSHGLRVFDVELLSTHGGSLRLYACHDGYAGLAEHASVPALIAQERAAGLDRIETYAAFEEQAKATKRDLLAFLIEARGSGKRVVGYGAPAKGNTLLNYCGIRTDFIDYTVDRSPHKQGMYLPGVRIPIHAPERIFETRPDYVLLLPWNLRDEITAQMAGIRAWGGRFVVPIPRVEVLP